MVTRRALIAQALAACATARDAGAAESAAALTAADVHPREYPTVAAVGWINEQLAAEFGGEIGLRVYHSGQLGSEKDTLELARIGALAITRVHSSVLNNLVPATRILSLPYVFDSTQHMRRAFDGAFGAEILAGCERHGLIGLALYDSGSRSFYNARHPIEKPADLHGLKLRVPQSDIFIESVAALGASPTPLAYNAVFSSLSTHLIDGAENNWPSYYTSRHFEIAPYWSESEHAYAPDVLLMSRRVADALPARQRDFLLAAARDSLPLMRARWDELVARARRTVLDAGVVVAPIDRPAFRRAVQPLLDRHLRDPELKRLYDMLRASA
jgi:tripartite ATP-independent transporter DctP family solute receptor